MAKGTEVETTEGPGITGYDPAMVDGLQWTTEHVEAADQVQFETPGDTLIGIYAGHEIIYPDPEKEPGKFFIQLKWTVPGGALFTNAGYELRNAYTTTTYSEDGTPTVVDKIPVGVMTRTVLMKYVDVDQQSEMKSFRVDSAPVNNGNADNQGS